MGPKRDPFLIGLILLFFLLLAGTPGPASALEKAAAVSGNDRFSLAVISEYHFDSHTSYEFGNPFPPYQAPLSRLEFPLDSWWAGAAFRARLPRFSVGLKALTNVSQQAMGRFRDSDWDDEADPRTKTIYSESNARMDPSYLIEGDLDLNVSDWLKLPVWLDLRPVGGFRWQQFNLVDHDGTQWATGEAALALPGDGIRFEQTYRHFFLGMRADFDLGKRGPLERLTTQIQVDWAYVEGHNQDHHLLRQGERYSYEDTCGQAWHGMIGLKAGLLRHLDLILKADFMKLSTSGTHRLVNAPLGLDLKWSNGVNVWSDQNSLSLMLEYTF